MSAAYRVQAYLDYILTYPAGIPVIRKVYGYSLHAHELRTVLDVRSGFDDAAASVEEFLAAFERTDEEVIDIRPAEHDPQHMLRVDDVVEVLENARRSSATDVTARARQPRIGQLRVGSTQ